MLGTEPRDLPARPALYQPSYISDVYDPVFKGATYKTESFPGSWVWVTNPQNVGDWDRRIKTL